MLPRTIQPNRMELFRVMGAYVSIYSRTDSYTFPQFYNNYTSYLEVNSSMVTNPYDRPPIYFCLFVPSTSMFTSSKDRNVRLFLGSICSLLSSAICQSLQNTIWIVSIVNLGTFSFIFSVSNRLSEKRCSSRLYQVESMSRLFEMCFPSA